MQVGDLVTRVNPSVTCAVGKVTAILEDGKFLINFGRKNSLRMVEDYVPFVPWHKRKRGLG
jgi:predicted site-specific integrase-resolvase